MRVDSIEPVRMRSTTTAISSRSPRYFGKILPVLGSPTWWPARPMRCRPRLTAPGDSTWMTRSTVPMSMPSSRLLVATSARSRPVLSSSSTRSRCSRAIEPWCACTSSSPASSLSRAARRSASRRALQKMSVVRCARMSSRMRGCTCGQMLERASPLSGPVGGSGMRVPSVLMSSMGTMTSRSSSLRVPASTTVTGRSSPSRRPPRKRAISSSGRCVAERPMRCGGVARDRVEPFE